MNRSHSPAASKPKGLFAKVKNRWSKSPKGFLSPPSSTPDTSSPQKADTSTSETTSSFTDPKSLVAVSLPLRINDALPNSPSPFVRARSAWQQALERLPPEDRETLNQITSQDNYLGILSEVLDVAHQQREKCAKNAWKVTLRGKTIELRKVAEKIILWVDKFKAVGNTMAQYDPTTLAPAWGAIRFLLQVGVDDIEKTATLLVALEKIANLMNRCEIYQSLHLANELPLSKAQENLARSLVDLYTAILQFLLEALKHFSRNIAWRSLSGAVFTEVFSLTAVEQAERTTALEFEAAEAEHRRTASRELNANIEATLKRFLEELDEPLKPIGEDVAFLREELEETKRNEILSWYSDLPYKQHHLRAAESRVENTGEWLFQHPEYQKWASLDQSSTLWLHGIPGSGKTKLASAVIEHISGGLKNDERIAYHYCARDEKDRSDVENILRNIIRQFSHTPGKPIDSILLEDYERRALDSFASGRPSLDGSKVLLQALLAASTGDRYIVIDALDESDAVRRRALLQSLTAVASSSPVRVKIFITSRDEQDIVRWMQSITDLPSVYIGAGAKDNAPDIECYVRKEVQHRIDNFELLNGDVDGDLRQRICECLIGRANGMFLWCRYQINYLCELDFKSEVMEALTMLPRTMDDTYARIYTNILSQKGSSATIGVAALGWIVSAQRPLKTSELFDALYTGLKQQIKIKPKELTEEVVEKCSGYLIVVDHQLGVFQPAHLTVKEYLQGRDPSRHTSETLAAKTCLQVINRSASRGSKISATEPDLEGYSVVWWMFHIQWCDARYDDELTALLRAFLGTNACPTAAYEYWHGQAGKWVVSSGETSEASLATQYHHLVGTPLTPLLAGALWGIYLPEMWDSDFDVKYRNQRNEPLLYLATSCPHKRPTKEEDRLQCGHLDITRKFLDRGADVNGEGGYNGYALANAVISKDENIVKLLLDHGARTDVRASEWSTALQLAVFSGSSNIAQLLIDQGSDVNFCSGYYHTALQCAAEAGSTEMVRLLLKNGADPNIIGGKWNSAIEAAAQICAYDIIELLLEASAKVDYRVPKSTNGTLLIAACRSFSDKDGDGRYLTILDDILSRLTLEDINGPPCDLFGTPVIATCCLYDSRLPILKKLLERGANPNIEGGIFGTALASAAYNFCGATIDVLHAAGANHASRTGYYGSVLSAAVWSGRAFWSPGIIDVLIRRGSDVNGMGGSYGTPLQYAAANGKIKFVQRLLDRGADINLFSDCGYGSPLQAAISTGRDDIVELLISKGAVVNTEFNLLNEDQPSGWSQKLRAPQTQISDDGLEISYSTDNWTPATVLADLPIGISTDYFYFEIEVLKPTAETKTSSTLPRLAIGLALAGINLETRPGIHTNAESWGYHSDDGQAFSTCPVSEPLTRQLRGPRWAEGDVVGVGVYPKKRIAFYTKNGRFIGIGATALKGRLYPAVGMSTEARIRANFGKREFVYKRRPEDDKLCVEMAGVVGEFRKNETAPIAKWG